MRGGRMIAAGRPAPAPPPPRGGAAPHIPVMPQTSPMPQSDGMLTQQGWPVPPQVWQMAAMPWTQVVPVVQYGGPFETMQHASLALPQGEQMPATQEVPPWQPG